MDFALKFWFIVNKWKVDLTRHWLYMNGQSCPSKACTQRSDEVQTWQLDCACSRLSKPFCNASRLRNNENKFLQNVAKFWTGKQSMVIDKKRTAPFSTNLWFLNSIGWLILQAFGWSYNLGIFWDHCYHANSSFSHFLHWLKECHPFHNNFPAPCCSVGWCQGPGIHLAALFWHLMAIKGTTLCILEMPSHRGLCCL